jgi:hypothetical protein
VPLAHFRCLPDQRFLLSLTSGVRSISVHSSRSPPVFARSAFAPLILFRRLLDQRSLLSLTSGVCSISVRSSRSLSASARSLFARLAHFLSRHRPQRPGRFWMAAQDGFVRKVLFARKVIVSRCRPRRASPPGWFCWMLRAPGLGARKVILLVA